MENESNQIPSVDEITQSENTSLEANSLLEGLTPEDLSPTGGESTEEVSTETQTEEVSTEEKVLDSEEESEHYLNDNGDVVDAEGNVIIEKDKVQFDEDGNVIMAEDTEILRLQESLVNELGIAFTDQYGNALQFENTDSGAVNMVKHAAFQLQQQFEQNLFTEYPQAADLIRHIRAGKSVDSFYSIPSRWRNTVIADDTPNNKEYNKTIRREALLEKEMITRSGGDLNRLSQEQIENLRQDAASYVDFIMSSPNAEEKAYEALSFLKQWENNAEYARNAENEQILQQREQQAQQFWTDVSETINSGNLGVFGVPKTERSAFLDYVSKPVDEYGNTQEMLDVQNEEMSYRLIASYFRFKNYNPQEAFKNIIRAEQANQLKGRKRKKVVVTKQGRSVKQPKQVGLDGISIDAIIK